VILRAADRRVAQPVNKGSTGRVERKDIEKGAPIDGEACRAQLIELVHKRLFDAWLGEMRGLGGGELGLRVRPRRRAEGLAVRIGMTMMMVRVRVMMMMMMMMRVIAGANGGGVECAFLDP
jgi:hypothetical protein